MPDGCFSLAFSVSMSLADHANTKIIQQMRSIGSSSNLGDGKTRCQSPLPRSLLLFTGTDYVPIPGIDLLVHILDALSEN